MFGRRKKKKFECVTDPDIFIIEDMVTDNNGIAVVRDENGNLISGSNHNKPLRSSVAKNKKGSASNFVSHFSSQEDEEQKKNKKRKSRFFDF